MVLVTWVRRRRKNSASNNPGTPLESDSRQWKWASALGDIEPDNSIGSTLARLSGARHAFSTPRLVIHLRWHAGAHNGIQLLESSASGNR